MHSSFSGVQGTADRAILVAVGVGHILAVVEPAPRWHDALAACVALARRSRALWVELRVAGLLVPHSASTRLQRRMEEHSEQ